MSAGFVFYKQTLTVYIKGELDHHTAKEIRFRIDNEIKRREPEFLELDFSGVTFMDSSGIGLVMGRYKIMTERGGRVVILNPPPPIKKVMVISGIGKLARIINCEDKIIDDGEKIKTEVKKIETCKEKSGKCNENSVSGAVAE